MITVSALAHYPVKSCRGIPLQHADVGQFGFRYDRQWMFVDDRGMFLAQRGDRGLGVEVRSLCFIHTRIDGETLHLTAPDMPALDLPLDGRPGASVPVRIWASQTVGVDQGEDAEAWASTFLSRERPGRYRLVRMADDTRRTAKRGDANLAFADGYPFLILSDASLADLNRRLDEPLPMNRFRPNIVLSGCEPYEEDRLDAIRIGGIAFEGMPLCPRCPIPTTNQETAVRGKEPLRTLATYRRAPEGIVFGRNFNHRGCGRIRVGDAVVRL